MSIIIAVATSRRDVGFPMRSYQCRRIGSALVLILIFIFAWGILKMIISATIILHDGRFGSIFFGGEQYRLIFIIGLRNRILRSFLMQSDLVSRKRPFFTDIFFD